MVERDPGPGREDDRDPVDEDAAWAAIVAAYGEEPPDPDLSDGEDVRAGGGADVEGRADGTGGADGEGADGEGADGADENGTGRTDGGPDASDGSRSGDGFEEHGKAAGNAAGPADRPLGSSVVSFPAPVGPRDWSAAEPSDDDFDETDDGHFVPPEPPPLPQGDTTAKFAWLAVLGGPFLLLLTVLLQWDMTWWIATLGIGGFLGGFGTLVFRMNDDDEDDGNPGRGAVV